MSRTNKAIKGVFTNILQSGLQVVLQITLAPLVLKMAGQETLGAYSIIIQILGYRILLDFGFSMAVRRYLAQAFGINDEGDSLKKVFVNGRIFALVINIVTGILIFLLSFFVRDFICLSDPVYKQLCLALYVLSIWTIIRTPISFYDVALTATQNMSAVNIIGIIGNAIRLLLSIFLVAIKMGILGLMLANILAEVVNSLLNYIYFKKLYPRYYMGWKIRDMGVFKEMFQFGLQYWGVNLAYLLFYGTDNIIVGHLLGAVVASIYYTTKVPSFYLFQFIFVLSDNSSPAVNELFAQKNIETVKNAYLKLLRYSILLTIPLAIGIIGFNKYVISLWVGPKQYAGDFMSVFLAMYAIFEVINHLNAMIAVASGNIKLWSLVSIVGGIICAGLSFGLGKLMGIPGVMLGMVLSEIPGFIYLLSRSMGSLKITTGNLWQEVINSSIFVISIPLIILVIIIKLQNPVSLWYVLPIVALFVISWLIGTLLKGLKENEKQIIFSFIRGKLWYRYQS